jgi:hypothetical protein
MIADRQVNCPKYGSGGMVVSGSNRGRRLMTGKRNKLDQDRGGKYRPHDDK